MLRIIHQRKNYIPIALVIIALLGLFVFQKKELIISYKSTDEIIYNPYMGFAPNADYYDAVGDNTLVYIDITFREWESEEDSFDLQGIRERNFMDVWEEQGKHAVLRFVCDIPGEDYHADIPDWLLEQMDSEDYYDTGYGKGYSPDYTDELFIKEHREAIAALGEAFGQDDFVAYVELGSLGHWGEWHVKSDEGIDLFPSEEVCREYVEPYVEAFPNAKLMMRRPFSFVDEYDMGVFNDMTGSREDTEEWLEWLAKGGTYDEAAKLINLIKTPAIWNKNPIGGEFTSIYSMKEMLTDRLEETVDLLESTHMTFIGPNCPISNEELLKYPEEVATVLNKVGYRYGVEKAVFKLNIFTRKANLYLTIHNDGVAPFYRNWPLYIYEYDETGTLIKEVKTDISLGELEGGSTDTYEIPLGKIKSLAELHTYSVGVVNPKTGEPELILDNVGMDMENRVLFLNK